MKSIALFVAAALVTIPLLLLTLPFMLLGAIREFHDEFDDEFEPHMESH